MIDIQATPLHRCRCGWIGEKWKTVNFGYVACPECGDIGIIKNAGFLVPATDMVVQEIQDWWADGELQRTSSQSRKIMLPEIRIMVHGPPAGETW